jgi:hypothetical protein
MVLAFSTFRQIVRNSGRKPLGESPALSKHVIRTGSIGVALGVSGSAIAMLWDYQTTAFQRLVMVVFVGYIAGLVGFYLGFLVIVLINSFVLEPVARLVYRVIRKGKVSEC